MPTNVASLEARFTANTANFDAGVAGVKRGMEGLERSLSGSLTRLGDKFTGLGQKLMPLSLGLGAVGAVGLKAFGDFDAALGEIQARTGATADQMDKVRQKAMEMGQQTSYSSTQAAQAMLELLASGYNLDETFTALGPTLTAAAAGGMDLKFTADAVTDVLAMWNLEADKAGYVADVLAKGAAASSAEIDSLALGLGNVGPLAAQFGLSLDDTVAILAAFSERGIKGAEAGTQLKSMLTGMTRDTEKVQGMWDNLGISMYTATGEIRPLTDVLADLRESFETATPENQIAILKTLGGSYGQLGLAVLTSGDAMGDMKALMAEQADAATVAAARLNTLPGVLGQVKSSFETLMIAAMQPYVEKYLKPMLKRQVEFLNTLTQWVLLNPEITGQIVRFGMALASAGPLLLALGKGLTFAGAALGVIVSPLGLVALGIAGLALAAKKVLAVTPNLGAALGFIGKIIIGIVKVSADIVWTFGEIAWILGRMWFAAQPVSDIFERIGASLVDLVWFGGPVTRFFVDLYQNLNRIYSTIKLLPANLRILEEAGGTFEGALWTINTNTGGAIDNLKSFAGAIADTAGSLLSMPSRGIDWLKGLFDFDLPSFGNLKETLGNAIRSPLEAIDVDIEPLHDAITSAISNMRFSPSDFDFKSLGDMSAGQIVSAISMAFGTVMGGPIGAGLRVVSLLVTALEEDFLGLRSAIESSGIYTSIENATDGIIEKMNSEFSNLGDEGGLDLSGVKGVIDDVVEVVQPIFEFFVYDVIAPIVEGMIDLGEGIVGFFKNLSSAETENIREKIIEPLLEFQAVWLGFIMMGAAEVFGGFLSTIGDVLPVVGQSIADAITAIDRAIGGDFTGALDSFGKSVAGIVDAFAGLQIGNMNAVVEAIETLTGLDLSGITDFFDSLLDVDFTNIEGGDFSGIRGFFQSLADLPENLGSDLFGRLSEFEISPDWQILHDLVRPIQAAFNWLLLTVGPVIEDLTGFKIPDTWGDLDTHTGAIKSALEWIRDNIEGLIGSLSIDKIPGWDDFRNTVEGIKNALDSISNFTPPELPDISVPGGDGGGWWQAGAGVIGSIFGGNAAGGSVRRGIPTWVGEQGPEIYIPGSDGRIIPNHRVGTMGGGNGGSGASVGTMVVNLYGVQDPTRMWDEIAREGKRRGIRIGVRA